MLEPGFEQLHSCNSNRHNDDMVLLTMTPSMVEALEKLERADGKAEGEELARKRMAEASLNEGDAQEDTEKSTENNQYQSKTARNQHVEPLMSNPKVGNPISHGQVVDISRDLKARRIQPNSLEALLKGSRVYVPPPSPKAEPVSETLCYFLNLELIFSNRPPNTKLSWHVSVAKRKNDHMNE